QGASGAAQEPAGGPQERHRLEVRRGGSGVGGRGDRGRASQGAVGSLQAQHRAGGAGRSARSERRQALEQIMTSPQRYKTGRKRRSGDMNAQLTYAPGFDGLQL